METGNGSAKYFITWKGILSFSSKVSEYNGIRQLENKIINWKWLLESKVDRLTFSILLRFYPIMSLS